MKKLILVLAVTWGIPSYTHAAAPDACGDEPLTAPETTLNDVNPSSTTYGQAISTSMFLGDVWVAYWAQSS